MEQNSPLLHLSILDNLTLFSDNIDFKKVIEVCQEIDLLKDLEKFPLGLKTEITDNISLSAGQIQKLQMVRAILRNTPIVLMDEITANVDQETEKIIKKFCQRMKDEGKLIIFISHKTEESNFADEKIIFPQK